MSNHTETVQVPIPDAEQLDLVTPGTESFDSMVARRQAAVAEMKRLKATIAECDIQINGVFKINDITKVVWRSDWVVYEQKEGKPRATVDPVKLLNLNVPASIIQEATVYGKPRAGGIRVRHITDKLTEETN